MRGNTAKAQGTGVDGKPSGASLGSKRSHVWPRKDVTLKEMKSTGSLMIQTYLDFKRDLDLLGGSLQIPFRQDYRLKYGWSCNTLLGKA